eukprot:5724300-Amphidinium_carterae.3
MGRVLSSWLESLRGCTRALVLRMVPSTCSSAFPLASEVFSRHALQERLRVSAVAHAGSLVGGLTQLGRKFRCWLVW